MFNKYIETQHVCISVSELFDWWDRLDALKDTPEKAFDLFTEFLEKAEDELELSDDIKRELEENSNEMKILNITGYNDLFDDEPINDYGNLTYNPYNWTIKEKK